MQFQFSFKHMETSESLKTLVQEKLKQKISRFATKPKEAHVTFEVVGKAHEIRCTLSGGDGFKFAVEAQADDMYAAVDMMVEKMVAQLKKQKEKLKSHKGNTNVRDMANRGPGSRPTKDGPDYVDAEDILKFEAARKKAANG